MSVTLEDQSEKALIVSSDGHVTARMEEYRAYIPERHHEEFDEFCVLYREKGSRGHEPTALLSRLDPDVVEQWRMNVLDPDRTQGLFDPTLRFEEMQRNGVVAEVLFPDFGLPFELSSPLHSAILGHVRTRPQMDIANHAYNRWLADFCSEAPDRFVGIAMVSFDDVDAAVTEIRWARNAGLRGVMLPMFSDAEPIFHPRFDPIWETVQELGMPVNSHIGLSGVSDTIYLPEGVTMPPLPHPGLALPIFGAPLHFFCHQLLNHLIWGGVLERHPDLQVVFTEQGSGWVIGALEAMDYSYEGSFLRQDIHEVIRLKPSEYFARQCHLGSSLFSRAEAGARHRIGVDKITVGVDYPHHEGTWGAGPGNTAYLRATLGAAGVPPDEARRMLGENAIELWDLDAESLRTLADDFGPSLAEVLTPPERDEFPRGDVHKPLSAGGGGG